MTETIADDVALRVAVHHEHFEGRPAAAQILGAVLDGVLRHIKVNEKTDGHDPALLIFSAQVAGYQGQADGRLVILPDRRGRMSDLAVFLRPHGAPQALGDEMGRRPSDPRPKWSASCPGHH